jgi:hypothetical protein
MKLYEILDRLSGYPEDTEILISDIYGNDCLNFELVHIKVPFGYALKLKPRDSYDCTNPDYWDIGE